ncbi:ORF021 [Spodoptera frugiperda granulovirus]|uniref:ORF021 n=1 Tax=Spodoptera frugiperda granulovirus TaxID=307454 RepID=A0A0C5ASB2_9BBAC|nr:ORF021 [Spodoptera frugiperda granulovirus]AJK91682.1 ORF021 [Spodoptera frugiperda granulovirus]
MSTPETKKFFDATFNYLRRIPVLPKPDQKLQPREYFLYQLLQCFVSYEEKSYKSTVDILKYLLSIMNNTTATITSPDFDTYQDVVKDAEEKQQMQNDYQQQTLKRKLAYEQRAINPQAFEEFNQQRVKRIETRRNTEPAAPKRMRLDDATPAPPPSPTPSKSPGFVVSSQEESEVMEYHMSPTRFCYEPSVPMTPMLSDLCSDDNYQPQPINTPAHIPPRMIINNEGLVEYADETPAYRNTEDLEESLIDVSARLEKEDVYAFENTPSHTYTPKRVSTSSSESEPPTPPTSPVPKSRRMKLQPPPPPPRRVSTRGGPNRQKGIVFIIKDKGNYSCMTGYLSYLKGKLKKLEKDNCPLLVQPMLITDDNCDLADVWTKLSARIVNRFDFIKKTNKTLKAKSISSDKEQKLHDYIVCQLEKLNFTMSHVDKLL